MEPGRLQSMGSHVGSDLAPMQYFIQIGNLWHLMCGNATLLFSRSVLLSLVMVLL